MSYQITGDLLSRTNHVVRKNVSSRELCDLMVLDLLRKGWINLKTTKEKKNASATTKSKPKQGRKQTGKGMASDNKSKPKDDSKESS
jgi:hypothetical protein